MNLTRLGVFLAFATSLVPALASAGQLAPAASEEYRLTEANIRWSSDGTRDALRQELKRMLGSEKNTFGPLAGDGAEAEGVAPQGSELLGDYIGHVIGIPGPELVLANGNYLYSGAEAHNAGREAALITRERGKGIVAMAVSTIPLNGGPNNLTILFPAGRQPDPVIQQQFTDWARREIARYQAMSPPSTFVHIGDELQVETRTLGRP